MTTLAAVSLASEPKATPVNTNAVSALSQSANIESKTLEEKFAILEEKFVALEKKYDDLHQKAFTENSGNVNGVAGAEVCNAFDNRSIYKACQPRQQANLYRLPLLPMKEQIRTA